MKKKAFYSQLFRRDISVNDKDYWSVVYAETLYRIKELEVKNCSCMDCNQDLDKLNNYLNVLRTHSQTPIK